MTKALIFFFSLGVIGFMIFLLSIVSENQEKIAPHPLERVPLATSDAEQSFEVSPSSSLDEEREQPVSFLTSPLLDSSKRVTKKFFGTKVSPHHSPVSPEKFSGYHTGMDFETFPEEQNLEVPVFAVCTGSMVRKAMVNGYGGVFLQQCIIEEQTVTVLYGHLKFSSMHFEPGQQILAGQQLGVLGKGYSNETSGERKHLHLGLHKGSRVDLRGYVSNQSELNDWIDAGKYLSH